MQEWVTSRISLEEIMDADGEILRSGRGRKRADLFDG